MKVFEYLWLFKGALVQKNLKIKKKPTGSVLLKDNTEKIGL